MTKGEKVYEGYEVQFQYNPGEWATKSACISTLEHARNYIVSNDKDFRIVKVEKYFVE